MSQRKEVNVNAPDVDVPLRSARGGRAAGGWLLIVGAVAGAIAMYIFDPQQGNRRRIMLRDKAGHYTRLARKQLSEQFSGAAKNARNRWTGLRAQVRYRLFSETPTDDVLVARVKSRLGHVVTHAHAIEVAAHDGHVVLHGPILMEEVDRAVMAVRLVPGVVTLENELDVRVESDGTPDLHRAEPTN